MRFNETIVTAKNGAKFIARSATVDESAAMLDYINHANAESDFLSRSPDDSPITIDEEKKFISAGLESPTSCNITLYFNGEIAGGCSLCWSSKKKIAHKGEIGIALRKKYWGMGLGTQLFKIIIDLAKQKNLKLLELCYIEGNKRGTALYKKMGFREVGRIPNGFYISENDPRDEIIMIKEL